MSKKTTLLVIAAVAVMLVGATPLFAITTYYTGDADGCMIIGNDTICPFANWVGMWNGSIFSGIWNDGEHTGGFSGTVVNNYVYISTGRWWANYATPNPMGRFWGVVNADTAYGSGDGYFICDTCPQWGTWWSDTSWSD